MPFFKPAKIKTGCVSLQVQKQLKNNSVYNFIFRKRAYLFISHGSITIEATIALTVFMMLVLFIESFIMMINAAMSIQINVNNIALEAAKDQFYIQAVENTTDKNKFLSDVKQKINGKIGDEEMSEDINILMKNGIGKTYLYGKLIKAIGGQAFTGTLCRINNFTMAKSSVNEDIIDMVVEYKINIPYVNKLFEISQRGMVRGWTGQDICQEQKAVYITKNGKVYHCNRDCSYLVVKISKASYAQLKKLRNCYGGKYYKCQLCVKESLQNKSIIFVTEDGNRYHTDLKCGGIKRNVISIDITQVGNLTPCSRCGQGE